MVSAVNLVVIGKQQTTLRTFEVTDCTFLRMHAVTTVMMHAVMLAMHPYCG